MKKIKSIFKKLHDKLLRKKISRAIWGEKFDGVTSIHQWRVGNAGCTEGVTF